MTGFCPTASTGGGGGGLHKARVDSVEAQRCGILGGVMAIITPAPPLHPFFPHPFPFLFFFSSRPPPPLPTHFVHHGAEAWPVADPDGTSSYTQGSTTSLSTIETTAQPSSYLSLIPPVHQPPVTPYSPDGGSFYTPAAPVFPGLDVRPRLGSK